MIDWEQYKEDASRTMAKLDSPLMDELHMVIGMCTEVGEIQDGYKKHMAYGKELDEVNIKEEIGDTMWYIANLCKMKGWDMNSILANNISKLKVRFPNKFTQEHADNRDLDSEREILETPDSVSVVVKEKGRYKDGGTILYVCTRTDTEYYLDNRIGSNTKGLIYTGYPGENGSNLINVKLIIQP